MRAPGAVLTALERLTARGHRAYLVGGCVRDTLLGLEPKDWDICTSAEPRETCAAFEGCRIIATGLRHGTVTVLLDSLPLEITTFRTDGAYSDGRHPDSVAFTPSLQEDLRRRDFTCNAMAWSPDGGLEDPFGGREDLARKLLRCVGEPELRFREDALRLLRALRFAGRYGFEIEKKTGEALLENRELLRLVSAERVFSELRGILCAAHAGDMLRRYGPLFHVILPELEAADEGAAAAAVDAVPAEEAPRLAALLHRLAEEQAGGALARLRCSNALRDEVLFLLSARRLPPPSDLAQARQALAAWGRERTGRLMDFALALQRAEGGPTEPWERGKTLAEEAAAEGGCLSLRELAVSGRELLALGFPAGPALGEALQALLAQVLRGETPNERGALLDRAAAMLPAACQRGQDMVK